MRYLRCFFYFESHPGYSRPQQWAPVIMHNAKSNKPRRFPPYITFAICSTPVYSSQGLHPFGQHPPASREQNEQMINYNHSQLQSHLRARRVAQILSNSLGTKNSSALFKNVVFMPWYAGLFVPRGQGVGLQDLRGPRGGPTGSLVFKG